MHAQIVLAASRYFGSSFLKFSGCVPYIYLYFSIETDLFGVLAKPPQTKISWSQALASFTLSNGKIPAIY